MKLDKKKIVEEIEKLKKESWDNCEGLEGVTVNNYLDILKERLGLDSEEEGVRIT